MGSMVAVIIKQGMHQNCICLHPCLSISFWEAFVLFVMHLFHAVFGILRFDINCHELKSGFPKLMCTSHREAVSRKPNACSSCCSINIVMLQNIMAPGAEYLKTLSWSDERIWYKFLKTSCLIQASPENGKARQSYTVPHLPAPCKIKWTIHCSIHGSR